MKSLLRRRTLWLAANVLGMAVYLKLASALWVVPSEEGMPGGPGDAFYWLFFLVPVLAAFTLVNSMALFIVVSRFRRSGGRVALVVWLAVAVLWAGTVVIDHQRQVRYIDAEFS
ncbi:hypothetical protein [Variovorax paradoxus]|uniref:hypothetical protein n=1 Tax=Variovorax paradoxus TaxID=34073 RepID=UPI00278B0DDB|nr:hypothetical protein [Variovorax paradoxus]MDQ0586101.1 uncharacterized membrane protein YozB (DUF420 family) [Variovorax paradoxus]